MTSPASGAILYPTFKGLSNSSFVQVATKKNSSSNDENTNSDSDKKLKLKREISSEGKELPNNVNFKMTLEPIEKLQQAKSDNVENVPRKDNEIPPIAIIENRQQGDIERPIIEKPQQGDIERPIIEKLPQGDIERSIIEKRPQGNIETQINTIRTVAANIKKPSISKTKLRPSEYFQSLKSKFPNQTLIINNTFINPLVEQEEFVTQLRQSFFTDREAAFNSSKNQSICNTFAPANTFELVKEHNDIECSPDQCEKVSNGKVENSTFKDTQTTSAEQLNDSTPVASIIAGILWITLIIFWFLLYFKVLKVYKAEPRVILINREPTNFEMCLVVIRRIRTIISEFWHF